MWGKWIGDKEKYNSADKDYCFNNQILKFKSLLTKLQHVWALQIILKAQFFLTANFSVVVLWIQIIGPWRYRSSTLTWLVCRNGLLDFHVTIGLIDNCKDIKRLTFGADFNYFGIFWSLAFWLIVVTQFFCFKNIICIKNKYM